MALPLTVLVLSVLHLIHLSSCVTIDYKAEYFQNTTLFCNDKVLSLPYTPFKIYWILPDESVLQPNDISRRDKYMVGRPPNYNLTILNVDDDDFDRYVCVILWDNSIYLVHAINVDLEIDGDKFLEIYRRNAMIGGICAASVLTVLCLGCLVYCFRYRAVSREIAKKAEEIRVMQELDQAVKGHDETVSDDSEPTVQPHQSSEDVIEDDVDAMKTVSVEINESGEGFKYYDNKTFQIDNESMVPYAESDIDKLPPYTVCDVYQQGTNYM